MSRPAPPAVLVIDDEAAVRGFLVAGLSQLGITVHAAPNGREGIELYRRASGVALTLVDARLPDLPGLQVLAALRQLDPSARCWLTAGAADAALAAQAVAAGAERLLPKPFGLTEVAQAVLRQGA